ncbi:PVC-type heme-binding CxxCH protein [Glaciecola sp. 1036]|uniref:PVC-type heme-binding CxxCH protein n=1 Tax=Alteromonadaceae TaxID=72275 RepID=UPI003D02930E
MAVTRYTSLALVLCSALIACSEQPSTQSAEDAQSKVTEQKKVEKKIPTKPAKPIEQIEQEAQLRMQNFKLSEGFEISLWADETQTQNPSFFTFDSQGRMLMVETSRFAAGVDDIRGHENKTVEDIYLTSNEERLALYEKYAYERPMSYYSTADDIIRLVQDTDGDGRADKSNVFSDGYDGPLEGIGAGVIERDGKVYFTNIPNLWMLEDTDGDGEADKKVSLQDGFGIRISFFGHDLHGLAWGPDGKLYWSIGDRGFNVKTKEGNHYYGPNLGGVFRSDPDGSNIEYFYNGLRNPQELAFDDYGNLFTADNDGDGGDTERLNYLVEGGDSGWHAGHQSIMSFTERLKLRSSFYTGDNKIPNAWMTQEMYVPRNDKQPAFLLPGIGKLNGGPSGFVHNPGDSFGEAYKDKFFVIHYMGTPASSYVSALTVEPDKAGFILAENQEFLRGFNAVDLDFGPDGALYLSEYNYGGWSPEGQGTVYRLVNPTYDATESVKQTQSILTSDFGQYDNTQLVDLIGHQHQRVRQRAQFDLAKRGQAAMDIFSQLATDKSLPELTRIHGIWGLSQMSYNNEQASELLETVRDLLADANPQIRIQAARVVGDHRDLTSAEALVSLLNDEHPRAAMYAAIGLGRMGYDKAIDKVIEVIEKAGDEDLFLRHGLVMALSGMSKDVWWPQHKHSSPDVRMAVLLAARKVKDSDIQVFLQDEEQAIVDEAITAINDLGIVEARPALAKYLDGLIDQPAEFYPQDKTAQWEYHRVINANYAQGDIESATRLLEFAASEHLPLRLASEALSALEAWNNINPIDATTGLPTLAEKQRSDISAVVRQKLADVLAQVKGNALVQGLRLAQDYDIAIDPDVLLAAVFNQLEQTEVRLQALSYLINNKTPNMQSVLADLTIDSDVDIRGRALKELFALDQTQGLQRAKVFLASEHIKDRQVAYRVLQGSDSPEVASLVLADMQNLNSTQTPDGATLELLALAEQIKLPEIQKELAAYKARIADAAPLTKYAASLYGGDPAKGEQIFSGGGATECLRCHMVNWNGGEAGPDLSNIGAERSRVYLLESIVDVQARIAPGYGIMVLKLKNGEAVSGIYQGEDETSITLELQDNKMQSYSRDDIQDIQRPVSGMPPMHLLMDEFQIRDIVAYLSQLERQYEKVEDVH